MVSSGLPVGTYRSRRLACTWTKSKSWRADSAGLLPERRRRHGHSHCGRCLPIASRRCEQDIVTAEGCRASVKPTFGGLACTDRVSLYFVPDIRLSRRLAGLGQGRRLAGHRENVRLIRGGFLPRSETAPQNIVAHGKIAGGPKQFWLPAIMRLDSRQNPEMQRTISSCGCVAPGQGLTLIELLVVIAIIALLTAILLTLQRARSKPGRHPPGKPRCGTPGAYASARGPSPPSVRVGDPGVLGWFWTGLWTGLSTPAGRQRVEPEKDGHFRKLLCCPMATKPLNPRGPTDFRWGGAFLAWTQPVPPDWQQDILCSYGSNFDICLYWQDVPGDDRAPPYPPRETDRQFWTTVGVKNSHIVPVALDSAVYWPNVMMRTRGRRNPRSWGSGVRPVRAGLLHRPPQRRRQRLFLDWSVRKSDWANSDLVVQAVRHPRPLDPGRQGQAGTPEWMRRFKDY
jgi:prepilin-type N-terminal cleavage/methylation domain-containing protein